MQPEFTLYEGAVFPGEIVSEAPNSKAEQPDSI
jgi:hypothetical protein